MAAAAISSSRSGLIASSALAASVTATAAARVSSSTARATSPLSASMAKAYASDAGWRVPDASIQVHGGIGFTWEHDLHFFLKRGRANASMYGDARWHREQVAKRVLAPATA